MYTLQPLLPALLSFRTVCRRPHIYPGGGTVVVTMRLAGSITRPAIKRVQKVVEEYGTDIPAAIYWNASAEERIGYRQAREGFYDRRSLNGPFHLHHNEAVRDAVKEALHFRDGTHWELIAYTLMPNHAHIIVRHIHPTWHMGKVFQHFKRHTARQCNQILGLTGQAFWEEESYDTVVKTGCEFRIHVRYVLRNPVVARLAASTTDWAGNWVREGVVWV